MPILPRLPKIWCVTEPLHVFHLRCRSSAAELQFGVRARIIAATTERLRCPLRGLDRASGRLFSEKPGFAFVPVCAETPCGLFVQHSRTAARNADDHRGLLSRPLVRPNYCALA